MTERVPPADDTKAMIIGGCHVRLTYGRAGACWTVSATVECGVGAAAEQQTLVSNPFESRDDAERDALERVSAILGTNTDRSHSRVRNWS